MFSLRLSRRRAIFSSTLLTISSLGFPGASAAPAGGAHPGGVDQPAEALESESRALVGGFYGFMDYGAESGLQRLLGRAAGARLGLKVFGGREGRRPVLGRGRVCNGLPWAELLLALQSEVLHGQNHSQNGDQQALFLAESARARIERHQRGRRRA